MFKNTKDQSTEKKTINSKVPPYIIKSVTVFEGLTASSTKQ